MRKKLRFYFMVVRIQLLILFFCYTSSMFSYGIEKQSNDSENISKKVSITDFGLSPDTRENTVYFVKKALQACKNLDNAELIFPKGRYDFFADDIQNSN